MSTAHVEQVFVLTKKAQDCLGVEVAWPHGVVAFEGICSRSAQAYAKIWSLVSVLASEVSNKAASGSLPQDRHNLLSGWRNCSYWLAQALDFASKHASIHRHKVVEQYLALSSSLLLIVEAQIQVLTNLPLPR